MKNLMILKIKNKQFNKNIKIKVRNKIKDMKFQKRNLLVLNHRISINLINRILYKNKNKKNN
jgi:hypothetical protein